MVFMAEFCKHNGIDTGSLLVIESGPFFVKNILFNGYIFPQNEPHSTWLTTNLTLKSCGEKRYAPHCIVFLKKYF